MRIKFNRNNSEEMNRLGNILKIHKFANKQIMNSALVKSTNYLSDSLEEQ